MMQKHSIQIMNNPVYSKCTGKDCNQKDLCVRYTSLALVKHQPWLCEEVVFGDGKGRDGCKWYLGEEVELVEEKLEG